MATTRSPEDHKADKGVVQGTDPTQQWKEQRAENHKPTGGVVGWVNYFLLMELDGFYWKLDHVQQKKDCF